MKRTMFLMLMFAVLAVHLCAQDGLQVGSLFDGRYRSRQDATEVILKGRKISAYGLSLFRSLTLPGNTPEALQVERLVKADALRATDKEAGMKGGRLYYGFYCFPPRGGQNRYLFYRNNSLRPGGKATLTLIYMEGTATIDELKRTFGK